MNTRTLAAHPGPEMFRCRRRLKRQPCRDYPPSERCNSIYPPSSDIRSPPEMEIGRGGKIRVVSGCVTCRIRRVKCDEQKPSCARCTSTGRKCDGYTNMPVSRSGSRSVSPNKGMASSHSSLDPSQKIRLPTFDDAKQLQSFAFFINSTCTVSPVYYGADFWSTRVLQLSLSEPAIRYALCSLSTLHRSVKAAAPNGIRVIDDENKTYSLQQYTNAVNHTQKLLAERSSGSEEMVIKGLVACILFVCYENLLANYAIAQMHLQNGLRILARYSQQIKDAATSQPRTSIPQDITQVLSRLDLQAMSFEEDRALYPYKSWPGSLEFPTFVAPLSSINEALSYLIELARWVFVMASMQGPNLIPQFELDRISAALLAWDADFQGIISSLSPIPRDKGKYTINVLKMYYTFLEIVTGTRIFGFEMLNDDFIPQYSHIVDLGTQVVSLEKESLGEQFFSFEIGIIFPLFFTGISCRDPIIRQRAIDLLASMNHQEGSWESVTAARVSAFVMGIEEEGLSPCVSASEILESRRVHTSNVFIEPEERRVDVKCMMCRHLASGDWYARKGTVFY